MAIYLWGVLNLKYCFSLYWHIYLRYYSFEINIYFSSNLLFLNPEFSIMTLLSLNKWEREIILLKNLITQQMSKVLKYGNLWCYRHTISTVYFAINYKWYWLRFLKAMLLSNCADVTDSLPSHRHSQDVLAISAISQLLVDRLWRSSPFCYPKFNKEGNYDGQRSEKAILMISLITTTWLWST